MRSNASTADGTRSPFCSQAAGRAPFPIQRNRGVTFLSLGIHRHASPLFYPRSCLLRLSDGDKRVPRDRRWYAFNMKYFLLSLSLAAAWAQQAPPAASADPVVLTVGNEKITKSQFEELIAGLPAQAQAQAKTPAGRKQLAEQLAELKTLAQEARAKKLDESKEVKARLALQAEQV